jgi:cellulose biosynthesis protein BcsQ
MAFKVKELSQILDISTPAISQRLKNIEDNLLLKSEKNRTVGIPRDTVAKILIENGLGHFYKKLIVLTSVIVGGSSKTTATWSLFNAFQRISPKKNPLILISIDSQASIDDIATGKISNPDDQKILVDYFSGNATIDDIIMPLNTAENTWIIPSNLNNVFLDKSLSSPQKIKTEALRLISDIYKKFPNTNPGLFIDTPPALSASTSSFILAMSQLMKEYDETEYNPVVCIPLRSDATSLKGSKIAIEELTTTLETFGVQTKPNIKIFLANYDKRLSLSSEILKNLFSHPTLKDYVADTIIRTSSEIPKASYNHKSIFHDKLPPVASDYNDLLLEILGFEKSGANA